MAKKHNQVLPDKEQNQSSQFSEVNQGTDNETNEEKGSKESQETSEEIISKHDTDDSDSRKESAKFPSNEILDQPVSCPDLFFDDGAEEVQPKPTKFTETNGGTKLSFYKYPCPVCKADTVKSEKVQRVCSDKNCDYGKPKRKENIPKEIVKYKIQIPELDVGVHAIKLILDEERGAYYIAPNQEKHIAKQVLKKLQNKPFKKLTTVQLQFMQKYAGN